MDKKRFNRLLNSYKTSRSSFDEIYSYYFHRIVFHVSWKFNKDIAEDVAQEFFVKLMRIELDEEVEFPTTWVYTVSDNIARSYLRKFKEYDELSGNEFIELKTNIEDKEIINKAFENLDELDRKMMFMYYWEGYSLKEIAEILKQPYDMLRKRHSRALKKLNLFFKNVSLF